MELKQLDLQLHDAGATDPYLYIFLTCSDIVVVCCWEAHFSTNVIRWRREW